MRSFLLIILSVLMLFLSQCKKVNFEIVSIKTKTVNETTSNNYYIIYVNPTDFEEMAEYAKELRKKNKSFVTEILFFDNKDIASEFKLDTFQNNKKLLHLVAVYNYKMKGDYEEFCYGNEKITADNKGFIEGWQKCNHVGLLDYFDRRLYK